MTVWQTVRATELTAVFSPQRKYKTVGSSPSSATKNENSHLKGGCFHFLLRKKELKFWASGYEPDRANNSKGDVATAASGGRRERKEAPRSTSAPRSKWAHCRAPQEEGIWQIEVSY